MSFATLFTGWFLVAWAVSWPIDIAVVAARRYVEGSPFVTLKWHDHAWRCILWSFVFALGASLVSTADLGWSP